MLSLSTFGWQNLEIWNEKKNNLALLFKIYTKSTKKHILTVLTATNILEIVPSSSVRKENPTRTSQIQQIKRRQVARRNIELHELACFYKTNFSKLLDYRKVTFEHIIKLYDLSRISIFIIPFLEVITMKL